MKNYVQHYDELRAWMDKLGQSLPKVMMGYGSLHENAIAEGALDTKTKELIALGIAVTVRCDGCISYHVHDALEKGASEEQIAETVGMAILMGGGPSVVYGIEATQAVEQFKKAL